MVSDRDHDGIPDSSDRCPDDPEDCDGFEDEDGCPDEDNDRDGLPDRCDRCPNQPAMTRNGCPRIHLEVQIIRIPVYVSFEPNGLKATYGDIVDQVVPIMKEARFKRIGVVGHALANEKGATKLATRRAEIVQKELVARGVAAGKLELRAAPPGEVSDCPMGDAGTPLPCVTFAAVESDSHKLDWDGTRYVEPPPPPEPPLECPPAPPRDPGHPCKEGP